MRAMIHAAAFAIALLLAGCGNRVETNITTFHALSDGGRGKSFVMVPYPNQQNSLEWRAYSDLVAQKLEQKGLIRSTTASGSSFAVFIAYAIDKGRTSVSAVPMYGQTGGGTTSTTTGYVGSTPVYGSTYTPPTYGVTGYTPVESTMYGRALKLTMLDVPQSLALKKPIPVYEATATSTGQSGELNLVMPAIVDAVFKDFPAPSGSTRTQVITVKNQ